MNCDDINFVPVFDEEQIEEVASMAQEIWSEHYIPIVGRPQIEYMLANIQSATAILDQIESGSEYYLCMLEGKICGYVAINANTEDDSLLLSKLYVYRSMRGDGVGYRMLEFVESICRQRRCRLLWLTVYRGNSDSIAWYERRGFRNIGVYVQDIGGGFVMNDYRMEKKIL